MKLCELWVVRKRHLSARPIFQYGVRGAEKLVNCAAVLESGRKLRSDGFRSFSMLLSIGDIMQKEVTRKASGIDPPRSGIFPTEVIL